MTSFKCCIKKINITWTSKHYKDIVLQRKTLIFFHCALRAYGVILTGIYLIENYNGGWKIHFFRCCALQWAYCDKMRVSVKLEAYCLTVRLRKYVVGIASFVCTTSYILPVHSIMNMQIRFIIGENRKPQITKIKQMTKVKKIFFIII